MPAQNAGVLTLEVISDIADLLALRNEWDDFARTLKHTTPFQLPRWQLTWWRHFGSGTLHVMVFRRGAALAGIVPCFLHEWEERRQLTLVGTGVSDYLEPLLAPEYGAEIVERLKRHLCEGLTWEVCNWQDLAANSPLAEIGGDALHVQFCEDTACTEISIGEPFEAFWEKRPHGLKRNVRRYREKAQQIAEPQFSVTCSAEKELMDALIRLHARRWQRHGESGMIAANHSEQFLRDIAAEFAAEKALRLFSLHFQGEVVAVILSLVYNNVLFSYLSAFDPDLEALGFGRTLLYEALRHAFEARYAAWDFLRGTEPYKRDWGAQAIPKRRLIIERAPSSGS